ncbi:MAG: SGNH/GDSL hydrolase family protein [Eubacteriales bacterium]|nr:SGNH/GDSL hydrolase family protein [Eubacteriales bacterium]MDD4326960.1 SGNH/GDSL hydrolase family protein [Eubacteriales bacterium]MDD4716673.1 SGNH/GDSL hydrolase family protein [Eubacteriales bacterium]
MKDFFRGMSTVLFQGDSITDCGRDRNDDTSLGGGYPAKIASIYKVLFPESNVRFINKGISGDRVHNLIERYVEDIYDVEPDFISILIGINDVWRMFDSSDDSTIEAFRDHYEYLLKSIKGNLPETKIMIMEPFVLHSLPDRSGWHGELDPRIQIVRALAAEYADFYLPLDGVFASLCAGGCSPVVYAADGVHPTDKGHAVIAYEYLKSLGSI